MFIDFHDGRLVSAAVAIVRRTEEGHDVLVMRPSEAIHDKLMRAAHQRQPVRVVEHLADVLPKRVPCPSR